VFNTILYTILCFDLIILLLSGVAWLDHLAYQRWQREIDRKGIQRPLVGFTDVSYREIPGRDTNR
jgi:hypothetical protein